MSSLKKVTPLVRTTAMAMGLLVAMLGHAKDVPPLKGDGKELVMFTITASNIYGANQIKGAEAEAARLGYKLKVFQNNFSQPEQDSQVQQYIASGAKPAAVIIWPWGSEAAINSARLLSRLGPVIYVAEEPNEKSWPYVKAYSGANQVLIGETLAAMLVDARKAARAAGKPLKSKNGNLLVFQHPEGQKTGIVRMRAFLDATKGEPFHTIHTEYNANSPETGYATASQVIPKYKGQFDFMFISNQQAATGVIRALKENGITPGKDVFLVSGDCSGSLGAIKNGETYGTGIQTAAVEGALAVRTAAKYAAHGRTEGKVIQLQPTAEVPPADGAPPAKFNYIPHAPAVGADGVAKIKIWGESADMICAGEKG